MTSQVRKNFEAWLKTLPKDTTMFDMSYVLAQANSRVARQSVLLSRCLEFLTTQQQVSYFEFKAQSDALIADIKKEVE